MARGAGLASNAHRHAVSRVRRDAACGGRATVRLCTGCQPGHFYEYPDGHAWSGREHSVLAGSDRASRSSGADGGRDPTSADLPRNARARGVAARVRHPSDAEGTHTAGAGNRRRPKSDFVATVSHEFRSPLTGIRQLGELLARGRVPSEERRQEYGDERITRESDRLSRLVENLLDFARMEEGRKQYPLCDARNGRMASSHRSRRAGSVCRRQDYRDDDSSRSACDRRGSGGADLRGGTISSTTR